MTDAAPSRCSPAPDLLDCRPVTGPAELAVHHAVRRAVFVEEQGLFVDDRDLHDVDPLTVHLLGRVDGEPAGTVRLYPVSATVWKGDRLAVLPPYRRSGLGGPLVRLAVATAAARGGTTMDALVQAANTDFFVALGWRPVGDVVDHVGVPHRAMTIPLG